MRIKKCIIFDFAGTLVKMRPATLLIPLDMLQQLSRKYQLGIITGGGRAEVWNIIKRLGICAYFPRKMVITKDDTNLRKPNARLLAFAMSQFGVTSAVYVGDSTKDQQMAKATHMLFYRIGNKESIGQIAASLVSSRSKT